NSSDEELNLNYELNIDLDNFFYTVPVQPSVAPPFLPPIYQPLVVPLPLPPPLNPPNPLANM
ncbi:24021_t:CDS:1, partial [Cetraspora pellucida]